MNCKVRSAASKWPLANEVICAEEKTATERSCDMWKRVVGYEGLYEVSDSGLVIGCSSSGVQLAALGINKTCKGYFWKYARNKEYL